MTFPRVLVVGLLIASASMVMAIPAQAGNLACQVQTPISAAELNASNPTWPNELGEPGTWTYEVTGMTPGQAYIGKLNWAGDPSNGAHPNIGADDDDHDGIVEPEDFDGRDLVVLPRWWQPDGMLPGYYQYWDPFNPLPGYVATPGEFSISLAPYDRSLASGKANCRGEVLP